MTTTNLRPCPYCNGTNLEVWDNPNIKYPDLLPSVECKDCGIMQHLDHWNSRPIEDGLRAEIEELRAQLATAEEKIYHLEAASAILLDRIRKERE